MPLWLRLILPLLIAFPASAIDLTGLLTADPQPSGNWERLVLPLKRSGNLLILEATIDSITGNFIVDTGAPYLVLNRTYFRQYETGSAQRAAGVSNDVVQATRTTIPKLSLGALYYDRVEADITNLAALENARKIPILGLLGANLFSSLCLRIDIQSNQLILYRTDAVGNKLAKTDSSWSTFETDTTPDIQLTFKLCDNKIFMPVKVAGQSMNWILDTGAETNVVDALSKKKVLKEFSITRTIKMRGSTGAQSAVLGTFSEINIGGANFAGQETILTNMAEINETCSMFIDGILGYNFLSQGTFEINFVNRQFSLYLYNALQPR